MKAYFRLTNQSVNLLLEILDVWQLLHAFSVKIWALWAVIYLLLRLNCQLFFAVWHKLSKIEPDQTQFLVLTCPDELCRQSHDASDAWYYNGDMILILVTLCVVMPLASFRNIEFLGYTSGFSISCMVFFTIVIIAKYFIGTESCPLFEDGIASGGKQLEWSFGNGLGHSLEDISVTVLITLRVTALITIWATDRARFVTLFQHCYTTNHFIMLKETLTLWKNFILNQPMPQANCWLNMLLETLLKILMGTVYKMNLEIIIPFLIENFTFLAERPFLYFTKCHS